jgi:glycosyltransferase involved in cell wall biosynthesis
VRLTVDLVPLLIRSAGVKSYLYHWYCALRRIEGAQVTGFPFLDQPGDLQHEQSTVGRWPTLRGLAWLQLARQVPHPCMEISARNCDVFHASNQVWRGPRRARLSTTLHDVTSWLTPDAHTDANRAADQRYLNQILRPADLILAVSESTRRDAIDVLGLDPARIVTVHSGVADAYFTVTAADAGRVRSKYGLDRPYVLFVGTVEPRKNLDRLLDAWRALHADAELIVVGASGWAPEATLRRLSSTAGVRRLGYLPEADLPGITKGALALAYPSLYEGFGFPVAQALVCGTPVVTSDVSSLPEIAAGAALLVAPTDTDALSEALLRIIEDGALRQRLAQAGLHRAPHFHWDRCAHESLACLQRLVR